MKKIGSIGAALCASLLVLGGLFTACPQPETEPTEERTLKSIEVNATDVKKEFVVGEEFNSDSLVVKAKYNIGAAVTLDATEYTVEVPADNLDNENKLKLSGETDPETVTVTVKFGDQTATYGITISSVKVSKIELDVTNAVLEYETGDEFDFTGIKVKAFYGDSDTTGREVTATLKLKKDDDEVTTLEESGTYTVVAEYAGITKTASVNITVSSAEEDTPADTGKESDLADYVYHKSIIASLADSWGSGTGITGTTTKTMVSGNLWGAGGVCGVSSVELGEIADYAYIVFTVDTADYTISEAQAKLDSNTGVLVKIPDVLARPAKWFTKNGKTTYYISPEEFSSAATATSIALIIGGEGTLVLEEFYLAATEEPAEKEIEYANTTVYESGVTLTQTHWWGDWTCEVEDGNLVSTGGENGCFGLCGFTPVPFKEGAKLEVTYKSNASWAVKPVAPEVESMLEASEDFTTVTVDLGSDSNLTGVGIVHKSAGSEVTISSIRVVDNE